MMWPRPSCATAYACAIRTQHTVCLAASNLVHTCTRIQTQTLTWAFDVCCLCVLCVLCRAMPCPTRVICCYCALCLSWFIYLARQPKTPDKEGIPPDQHRLIFASMSMKRLLFASIVSSSRACLHVIMCACVCTCVVHSNYGQAPSARLTSVSLFSGSVTHV
jgi:hypothetical protein